MGIEPRAIAEGCQNLPRGNLIPDFPGETRPVGKVGVSIVTAKEHQLVIAAQPDYLPACFGRLALKRPEESYAFERVRPPIDDVARLDEQRFAACPTVTIVDQPGVTEYLPEPGEVTMDVADCNTSSP